MLTRILVALLCGCAARAAVAETVIVNNDQVQVRESQIDRPKRGSTKTAVEKKFGTPVTRHATVGEPPITRWDYPQFAVVFERDRVIDAVVTGG
jgi:outer membrane protein assembly factor BamE (lipoprotein component of BamABCDE complex)